MLCDDIKYYYVLPRICYNESVSDASHRHESLLLASSARKAKILSIRDVSKLYLQPRHRTNTALTNGILAAGAWDRNMANKIKDVFENRECRSAFNPRPHYKLAVCPPSLDTQANISIAINHLVGRIICIYLTYAQVGPRRVHLLKINGHENRSS